MGRIRALTGSVMRRIRAGRGGSAGGSSPASGAVNVAMFTLPWPSDATLSVTNSLVLSNDITSSAAGNNYVNAGYVDTGYVT